MTEAKEEKKTRLRLQRDMLWLLLKLLFKRRWKEMVLGTTLLVGIVYVALNWGFLVDAMTVTIQRGLSSAHDWLPTTLGANYLLIVLIAATVGVAFIPFLGHAGIVRNSASMESFTRHPT